MSLLLEVLESARQNRLRPKFDSYAHRETEADIAARLAVLEARDPSQVRPTPRDNANNRVDWIDYA